VTGARLEIKLKRFGSLPTIERDVGDESPWRELRRVRRLAGVVYLSAAT
jgi:hypothetical protein